MLKKILFANLIALSIFYIHPMNFKQNLMNGYKALTEGYGWAQMLFEEDKANRPYTVHYNLEHVVNSEDEDQDRLLQPWVNEAAQLDNPKKMHLEVFFNETRTFKDHNGISEPAIMHFMTECSDNIGSLKSQDGVTPLHYFVDKCDDNTAKATLDRIINTGGNPLAKAHYGNVSVSPLEIAIAQQKWKSAKKLAKKAKVCCKPLRYLQPIFDTLNQQRDEEGLLVIPTETVSLVGKYVKNGLVSQCKQGKGVFIPLKK